MNKVVKSLALFTIVSFIVVLYYPSFADHLDRCQENPLLHPAKKQDPIDLQRRIDIRNIRDALLEYMAQHEGKIPTTLPPQTPVEICSQSAADCTGYADLRFLVPDYLRSLPSDPQFGKTLRGTQYFVTAEENPQFFTISAPNSCGEPKSIGDLYYHCNSCANNGLRRRAE